MRGKLKYIVLFLALAALVLPGISGCTPEETTTPPPSTTTPPAVEPGWTFPPAGNQSSISLPTFAAVVDRVKPAVVAVTTDIAKGS